MIIDISFSSDHKIARLCGSLSEYSGIDPVKDSLLMNKFGDLFLDYPQDTSHHSFQIIEIVIRDVVLVFCYLSILIQRVYFLVVACSPFSIKTEWITSGSQYFPLQYVQNSLITISESPHLSIVDQFSGFQCVIKYFFSQSIGFIKIVD